MSAITEQTVGKSAQGGASDSGSGSSGAGATSAAGLALAALGVVFGDIGTSPLYAMKVAFESHKGHSLPVTDTAVFGLISMIFWAVTIVVTAKYVVLITRADNDGEGGIMALIAMIRDKVKDRGRITFGLVMVGLCGASLFYGDSVLTPAISVLAALEGTELISKDLSDFVLPAAALILIGLFAGQRFGTDRVGKFFGPVMLVWFVVLAALGLPKVVANPGIIRGLSPQYAIDFALSSPLAAFTALGAVVLTITGGEALYADMGHFGRPAIVRAWLLLAFPCLMINYLGQAQAFLDAAASNDGAKLDAVKGNPLFALADESLRVPLVVLATLATIIASQAVISGAFSLTRQASLLGFLPRVRVVNTSHHAGQVYVPIVNWALLVLVLTLVFAFRSSDALASAYGIAVIACTLIDTILFFFVVRVLWRRSRAIAIIGFAVFATVDALFLAACARKIPDGGFIPIAIAAVLFLGFTTWYRGAALITDRRRSMEGELSELVESVRAFDPPISRTPGTAIFLHAGSGTAPLSLRSNIEHNRVLHERTVIVRIEVAQVPHVPDDERFRVDDLGYVDDGIIHVTGRYGFLDDPDVPALLESANRSGLLEAPIDVDRASYFLSRMELRRTRLPGLASWRKPIFQAMMSASSDPVRFFGIPYQQAVLVGAHVDL